MPTVMSEYNEEYCLFIDFVKQMIGKSLKIGFTKATGIKMVRSWVPFDGSQNYVQLAPKCQKCPLGNFGVV